MADRKKRGSQGGFVDFDRVEEIGSGGFSTVYRAREAGTGRDVALKVLSVADVTPHALESFRRESVALGAVSTHPNIVTLYRQELLPDGRPMLVLELCNGSIANRLRGGEVIAPREAIAICVKIAGALETAHRAGMLHRDVKPQNILITGFGEPALADFGVARLQASAQATVGVFGFTTLHAPPELLEGKQLSAASDVYELASTLYQMLAGKAAFTSFDNENPASIILRILRDPVAPLFGEGIPAELSDLLVAAMSKEPSERPQTAAAFAESLRAIEAEQGWEPTSYWVRDPEGSGGLVSGAPTSAAIATPSPVAPKVPGSSPATSPAFEYEAPLSPAWPAPDVGARVEHTVHREPSPWLITASTPPDAAPPPARRGLILTLTFVAVAFTVALATVVVAVILR